MSRVIVFEVSEDADGCYVASALGESIYTEGETMPELRRNVCAAVHSQFCDSYDPPKVVIMRIAWQQDQRIALPDRFFEPFGLHSVPEKELVGTKQEGSEIQSFEPTQTNLKTKPCVCGGSNANCRYCDGSGYVRDDKAIPHLPSIGLQTWMPNSLPEVPREEMPPARFRATDAQGSSKESSGSDIGWLWWLAVLLLIFLLFRLFK
jgi:hypothetical protein